MLCAPSPIRSVSVTVEGNYFCTTSVDKTIKVWDLRNNYTCLKEHKIYYVPDRSDFSQLGMLAVAGGSTVTVYKDVCHTAKPISPYLKHNVRSVIHDLSFCNYEDVLGIGHQNGFTSLLTPGSGEPIFDSLEANPFMSKTQQREMEIKMLMEKISPQLICLDPSQLATTRKEPSK